MKKILLNTLLFLSTTWTFAQTYGNVSVVTGISTNAEVGITQNYPFQFNPQPPSNQGYSYYVIDWWSVTTSNLGQAISGHVNNIPNTNIASIYGNWEQITVSTPKYISIPIAFGELSPKESYIKVSCSGTFYKAGGASPLYFFTEIVKHNINLYKVKPPTISSSDQFLDCCTQNVNICASDYSDANSFTWAVSGGTIASGQGSSCISVTPNATGSMTTSCTVKRTTGLPNYTATNSKTFYRTARTANFVALYPDLPEGQPFEFICKESGRQMQMQNQCGLTSINWVANNCTITGQNTLTPTITPNNSLTNGSNVSVYAVVSFNGGCTATTPSQSFLVFQGGTNIVPSGRIIKTPDSGDICNSALVELSFNPNNQPQGTLVTITPPIIRIPSSGIVRKSVKVCYQNLCDSQFSCRYYTVSVPSCDKISGILRTSDSENIISITPNPSNGKFNISFEKKESGKCQIFDQTNNVLIEQFDFKDESKLNIELSSKIKSGIFILKIITENNTYTEHIIIK